MRITLLTLFPEFFTSPLAAGLLGKGLERGVVRVEVVNPRDFATDRHRTVDDRPYGGGAGMVMMLDPLVQAIASLPQAGRLVQLTPRGRPLTQGLVRELSAEPALTLICGRYEGIDQRLSQLFPVTDVSVGDFVLNGGESAALCLLESVARLLPGFMGKEASGEDESFSHGLLEYPHYTRPEVYRDLPVPEVLLSGDHGRIAVWRREQALAATLERRPELLAQAPLSSRDQEWLAAQPRAQLGRNLHLALVHYPVLDKRKKVAATSLTNLDLHDIARVSRTYGGAGCHVVTPLADQRELAATLLAHWTQGAGAAANPDRAEALGRVRVAETLDAVIDDVTRLAGQRPWVVATSARREGAAASAQVRERLRSGPVLLVLGTGFGLAREVIKGADAVLKPIRPLAAYNHLSVRSAAAICLDRILGDLD